MSVVVIAGRPPASLMLQTTRISWSDVYQFSDARRFRSSREKKSDILSNGDDRGDLFHEQLRLW
ncbi:hypothetical protein [Bradyrhizobium sp. BTAi1]|jgi:hypothetical protein|uniref:hypothetical protein n=1 Tax=unclassified Bradyrhizobium TaxID=2631580 RepID=UPI0002D92648|nr:hypothetical protein [Bradyrhizobium sp. BTAi1]MCL8483750.1 hypothetical protein [Bradyrhizobium denitrificans]